MKVSTIEDHVAEALIGVFQHHGYEGASLALLSKATGLIKASLYHRFPRGKSQMALAALAEVDRRFAHHVLEPIETAGTLEERLSEVCMRLRQFYGNGQRACLIETLSLKGTPVEIRDHARQTLEFWRSRFAQLAREAGCPVELSMDRADDAIASIEGSLIISRASGGKNCFERALYGLRGTLTGR